MDWNISMTQTEKTSKVFLYYFLNLCVAIDLFGMGGKIDDYGDVIRLNKVHGMAM